jgi:hypothetical protein
MRRRMPEGMSTTSLRVSVTTRDALDRVAHDDSGGVSAEAALQRLLDEHPFVGVRKPMNVLR